MLAPPTAVQGITSFPFLSSHSRHASESPFFSSHGGRASASLASDQALLDPLWQRVTLRAGSALYIPPGHWHAIRTAAGEVSVSASVFSDSAIDTLADAVSTLPFDVDLHVHGAVARALAVYAALLVSNVLGEASVHAFMGTLTESITRSWRIAGVEVVDDEPHSAIPQKPQKP